MASSPGPCSAPPKVLAIGPLEFARSQLGRLGRMLTDGDLDAIADEVESDIYDVEVLKAALEDWAEADHTTTSEIIREASRRFLEVAYTGQGCCVSNGLLMASSTLER